MEKMNNKKELKIDKIQCNNCKVWFSEIQIKSFKIRNQNKEYSCINCGSKCNWHIFFEEN